MNFYEQIFSRGRATGEGMTHFERLFAAKFGGSPPPEVREYTGSVPVTITADGTPLLDYLITGNTTQSGTPTSDSPVMPQGTGDKTANLFDKNAKNTANGFIQNTMLQSDGTTLAWNVFSVSEYIPVEGGAEYYLSQVMSSAFNAPSLCFYDSSKQFISSVVYQARYSFAMTTPATAAYVRISYMNTQADVVMLNTGSTAKPYEPFGVKIPILSASTTTPVYLGEVPTTRKIKKLVFDGTEDWMMNADGWFYLASISDDYLRSEGNITSTCSHYPTYKQSSAIAQLPEDYTGFSWGSAQRLYLKDTSHRNDLSSFKQWVASQYANGTPVCVWYVLSAETTGIVNEPLMRIGDYADTLSKAQADVSIPTNNGSTTVDVDTTVKPSEVYIKYMG